MKLLRDRCLVEYGEKFPEKGDTMITEIPSYGLCKILIDKVSTPEWVDPYTVSVETDYFVVENIEPNSKYKKEQIGLSVVK